MWFRMDNETDLAEGSMNWDDCYNDLCIRDIQGEAVPARAVPEPGRCNLDLADEEVFNKCLDGIRRTGTLWLPLANMFNPCLAKVDLAGKGKVPTLTGFNR